MFEEITIAQKDVFFVFQLLSDEFIVERVKAWRKKAITKKEKIKII